METTPDSVDLIQVLPGAQNFDIPGQNDEQKEIKGAIRNLWWDTGFLFAT